MGETFENILSLRFPPTDGQLPVKAYILKAKTTKLQYICRFSQSQ